MSDIKNYAILICSVSSLIVASTVLAIVAVVCIKITMEFSKYVLG
jgi:hypothetical protein